MCKSQKRCDIDRILTRGKERPSCNVCNKPNVGVPGSLKF